MPSFNQLTVIGHMVKDPEVRFSGEGKPFCTFSVATNEYNAKTGKSDPEYFDCVAFGKTAEYIGKYVRKGSPVTVVGPMRSNKKDGKKYWSVHTRSFISFDRTERIDEHGEPTVEREDVPF